MPVALALSVAAPLAWRYYVDPRRRATWLASISPVERLVYEAEAAVWRTGRPFQKVRSLSMPTQFNHTTLPEQTRLPQRI